MAGRRNRSNLAVLCFLCVAAILLTMLGCSDGGRKLTTDQPNAGDVIIDRLVPARTVLGDSVVVEGSGFGSEAGAVLFSSSLVTVQAQPAGPWSDSRVAVLVPAQAVTGPIKMQLGERASNTVTFTVAAASIYGDDVLPLFERSCASPSCHGGNHPQRDLDVLSREGLLRGGTNGPALQPRHSASSLLVRRLKGEAAGARMPRAGPYFSETEILKVADWIDQGARPDVAPPPTPQIQSLVPGRTVVLDEVVVHGREFGATQGSSTVTFSSASGTIAASSTAWTDTSLSVIVPAAAVTGTVRVHRNGVASTPVTFEVAPRRITFRVDLTLLLETRGCSGCHAGGNVAPRLDVTSYAGVMQGNSDHGPVIRPRRAANSLLIQKLRGTASFGLRMPQGGPSLSQTEILLFSDWIDQGALDN